MAPATAFQVRMAAVLAGVPASPVGAAMVADGVAVARWVGALSKEALSAVI